MARSWRITGKRHAFCIPDLSFDYGGHLHGAGIIPLSKGAACMYTGACLMSAAKYKPAHRTPRMQALTKLVDAPMGDSAMFRREVSAAALRGPRSSRRRRPAILHCSRSCQQLCSNGPTGWQWETWGWTLTVTSWFVNGCSLGCIRLQRCSYPAMALLSRWLQKVHADLWARLYCGSDSNDISDRQLLDRYV